MGTNQIYLDKLSDKELGYLLGFFLGDGYLYYYKSGHYVVEFYLNSKKDIKIKSYIVLLMRKIGLKPFLIKDRRFNSIRIKVNSKKLFKFIRKEMNLIKNYNYTLNQLIGFVSGFIDADGYVENGEIQLTQKEKENLLLIKKMCDSIGIKVRKFWSMDNYKTKNKIWRMRISTSFKYIGHNSIKVFRKYGIPNSEGKI
ncbi:MAG: hypothetical protein GF368_03080 [Candidatus Aenigmarchaeota archaeon]|nr:hypothetical protein [Candidatus Aenigmarchaeota archaeon]